MSTTNSIISMAKQNNGIVTTAMVVEARFSRGNLNYLVDKGLLEKASRGVYTLPQSIPDEIFSLQNQFKRGIYSNDSALFLLGLTDRTPNHYAMTFPTNYNLTKPKQQGINCTQCKRDWYELGIVDIKTPGGSIVKTYNKERTLCDILRPNSSSDIQTITESFKRYTVGKDKNIPLLSEYAKTFKVEKRVRTYLEVLL